MTNKRRKHRRMRRRAFFIVFLIIGIIFGGIKLISILKPMLGFEEKELKTLAVIDFKSADKKEGNVLVKNVSNYITSYDGGKISVFDYKGKLLWEKSRVVKEPLIIGNDNIIILIDMLSGAMEYFDYSGNSLATINLGGKIFNGKIINDTFIAIALEEDNKILLLNQEGQEISRISIPKGEIIDFQLSNDGNIIGVALLNLEEYDYYSNILLYSTEGRVLAGNKIEDSIIYYLEFDKENRLVSIGDNKILLMARDEGLLWEKQIEGTINAIDSMDTHRIVINSTKEKNIIIDTKNRNSVIQMDLKGEVIHQTSIIEEIIGLDSIENTIIAFSKRTIYLIDNKGKIFMERKINKDIDNVSWVSDGVFVLVFKDRMEIMTLNY